MGPASPTATTRRCLFFTSFRACTNARAALSPSIQRAGEIRSHIVEEDRSRSLALAQRGAVVGQTSSPVGESVADRLENGNRAGGSLQTNRPRSFERGLGREVQAECDAEFAL